MNAAGQTETVELVMIDLSEKVNPKTRINAEGKMGMTFSTGEDYIRPGSRKFTAVMTWMKDLKQWFESYGVTVDHIGASPSCDKVWVIIDLR